MSPGTFRFRRRSSHISPDRATPALVVELLADSGEWQPQVTGDFRLQREASASSAERARADGDAIAFIKERMQLCPVSRHLPASVVKQIDLSLID